MEYKNIAVIFGILCSLIINTDSCEIVPNGVTKPPKSNADGRFIIDITGSPKSYVPLQFYTVTLKLNPTSHIRRTFREFVLAVESDTNEDNNIIPQVGNLHLTDDMKARFSETCPNTVIQSSSLAKTEIKLFWQAPPSNSGCVIFKAAVAENREVWYSYAKDDRHLSIQLCEEQIEDLDTPPTILKQCCACDEATYEMAFEGAWSRNTHPKDFPNNLFSTKFSDIIGASHSFGHAFWSYTGVASDGLELLAEEGDTTGLEDELKEMNENIRTIIKARGLTYPNIKGPTFAIFRVDNQSHLISLVSKVIPSPDWFVGVSNYELCTRECSWVETKTINLYPWDAGTDDGITYTATEPRRNHQQIRRIKSNSPSDERSPFFNEEGEEMNPMARLHLTRLRVYKKPCDSPLESIPAEEGEEAGEMEPGGGEQAEVRCATTEWSEWSPCSKVCEEGNMFRSRTYLNPSDGQTCRKRLVTTKRCLVTTPACPAEGGAGEEEEAGEEGEMGGAENGGDDGAGGEDEGEGAETSVEADDPRCELTKWGAWSGCSATCGRGTRTRDRRFKRREFAGLCAQLEGVELEENEECEGEERQCAGMDEEGGEDGEQAELCPGTKWGYWSPCNASCDSDGKGYKERYVLVMNEEMEAECSNTKYKETVDCTEPCDEEEGDNWNPFNPAMDSDSQTNFPQVILQEPTGEVQDCRVSGWSRWTSCNIPGNRACGNGYRQKTRRIMKHPLNGGKACPRRLRYMRRCHIPCEEDNPDDVPAGQDGADEQATVNCVMGEWSPWSPCSTDCGDKAVQVRTRKIEVPASEGGEPCGSRVQYKNCPLPVACTKDGVPTL